MRRRRAFRRRSCLRVWLCLFALLAAVWASLSWADARLRPQLHALAAAEALAAEEHALNDAVLRTLGEGRFDALVTVEQNDAGAVTSIRTDAIGVNVLKARVCEAASAVLAERAHVVHIPAGSLTGLDILAGRGPSIRVRVRTSGFANAEIESAFSGAGVNQTVHRLLLHVRADVCLAMAKTQTDKQLSYEVCIAETVIVGEVPALYADLGNGE